MLDRPIGYLAAGRAGSGSPRTSTPWTRPRWLPSRAVPLEGVLLDTQVLLWWLADDARLYERPREVVASAEEVAVSVVSAREISLKAQLDKLDVPEDLRAQLVRHRFSVLPQRCHAMHEEPSRNDPPGAHPGMRSTPGYDPPSRTGRPGRDPPSRLGRPGRDPPSRTGRGPGRAYRPPTAYPRPHLPVRQLLGTTTPDVGRPFTLPSYAPGRGQTSIRGHARPTRPTRSERRRSGQRRCGSGFPSAGAR